MGTFTVLSFHSISLVPEFGSWSEKSPLTLPLIALPVNEEYGWSIANLYHHQEMKMLNQKSRPLWRMKRAIFCIFLSQGEISL
jgi:hypothetical protein